MFERHRRVEDGQCLWCAQQADQFGRSTDSGSSARTRLLVGEQRGFAQFDLVVVAADHGEVRPQLVGFAQGLVDGPHTAVV